MGQCLDCVCVDCVGTMCFPWCYEPPAFARIIRRVTPTNTEEFKTLLQARWDIDDVYLIWHLACHQENNTAKEMIFNKKRYILVNFAKRAIRTKKFRPGVLADLYPVLDGHEDLRQGLIQICPIKVREEELGSTGIDISF